MISASEAREISSAQGKFYLDCIEEYIRKAAKEGRTEVIIREEPYARWLYNKKLLQENNNYLLVIETLKSLDYIVEQYYNTFSKEIDLGLYIKW